MNEKKVIVIKRKEVREVNNDKQDDDDGQLGRRCRERERLATFEEVGIIMLVNDFH